MAIYKSVKSEPGSTDVWITIGISENKTNINVYPNPATDGITIETSLNFEKISIYNLHGQEVYYPQTPGKLSYDTNNRNFPGHLYTANRY